MVECLWIVLSINSMIIITFNLTRHGNNAIGIHPNYCCWNICDSIILYSHDIRRTKRSDQIAQINIIIADLRNLDLEIEKIPSGSEYDDTRNMWQWHSRIFNTLKYSKLAFVFD